MLARHFTLCLALVLGAPAVQAGDDDRALQFTVVFHNGKRLGVHRAWENEDRYHLELVSGGSIEIPQALVKRVSQKAEDLPDDRPTAQSSARSDEGVSARDIARAAAQESPAARATAAGNRAKTSGVPSMEDLASVREAARHRATGTGNATQPSNAGRHPNDPLPGSPEMRRMLQSANRGFSEPGRAGGLRGGRRQRR
ncbi:MAG: hypothetical protein AAF533_22035 [Acidobacteriota bacterium]